MIANGALYMQSIVKAIAQSISWSAKSVYLHRID